MTKKRSGWRKLFSKKTTKEAETKKIKPTISKLVKKKAAVKLPETKITPEESKYYVGPTAPPVMEAKAPLEQKDLPSGYGEDRIVLLVRDPWWLYTYWEVTDSKKEQIQRESGCSWGELRKVLRIYDVTNVKGFNGYNANRWHDIDINDFANNWYIEVGAPDSSWCVDLGAIDKNGKFYLIVRSNIVSTPPAVESLIGDEEFWKIYALSGGFKIGLSSAELQQNLQEIIEERLRKEISSGAISSPRK